MDETEAKIMDAWRLCQSLTLAEPADLAANLRGLIETRDYLICAINVALKEHTKEAA